MANNNITKDDNFYTLKAFGIRTYDHFKYFYTRKDIKNKLSAYELYIRKPRANIPNCNESHFLNKKNFSKFSKDQISKFIRDSFYEIIYYIYRIYDGYLLSIDETGGLIKGKNQTKVSEDQFEEFLKNNEKIKIANIKNYKYALHKALLTYKFVQEKRKQDEYYLENNLGLNKTKKIKIQFFISSPLSITLTLLAIYLFIFHKSKINNIVNNNLFLMFIGIIVFLLILFCSYCALFFSIKDYFEFKKTHNEFLEQEEFLTDIIFESLKFCEEELLKIPLYQNIRIKQEKKLEDENDQIIKANFPNDNDLSAEKSSDLLDSNSTQTPQIEEIYLSKEAYMEFLELLLMISDDNNLNYKGAIKLEQIEVISKNKDQKPNNEAPPSNLK
jgi:hypothetical protein